MPSGIRKEPSDRWGGWVYLALGIAVVVAMGFVLTKPVAAQPIPQEKNAARVELVKMFHCNFHAVDLGSCTGVLENQANEWLQKAQPGIGIRQRLFTSNRYGAMMAIFYEVPEWRSAKFGKPPAEATP